MAAVSGQEVDPEKIRSALDRFSFAKQSGRKAGQENRASFLRKGQAGDWRNHFTRQSAEMFDRRCGRALIGAGYEPDNAWVARCPESNEQLAHAPAAVAAGGGA